MAKAGSIALLVGSLLLTNAGCAPEDAAAAPPPTVIRTLDPVAGLPGVIEFGEGPDVALAAFGPPDRQEQDTERGRPSTAIGYDKLGLYLTFIDGGLHEIIVTSDRFRISGALEVGCSFTDVHQVSDDAQRYTPGATGYYRFATGSSDPYTGRLYATDGSAVYRFLGRAPNDGHREGGSDDRVELIVLSAGL